MLEGMPLLLLATSLLVLALPGQAFAWGAGVHLQLGMNVLNNLDLLKPAVAAIISAHPYDFLYGTIAADITLGKKFTHYLQHCHRWRIGHRVLDKAGDPAQQACAYGYLSHLAADCIAHNYYVPYKVMRSFSSLTLKHAYWEMRFENYVEKEIWETAKKVSLEHFSGNDELLRKVLSDTIFSFGTNKKIFNSILLVSRLEKWQSILQTLSDTSRYALEENDREEYMQLAQEAVFDFLNNDTTSRFFHADPTGERALAAAEAVRKNLRLLYRTGKITKPQAYAELDELKLKLKEAICEPELLLQILSK
ncbi:zinc dependent phospholipase C family protein [Geomonas subterranea]|uniref:Zinc dependent phospholipase C family protein n=2 Tax=Geomonas subterranea TaxID=2847989 RepID=A0ABX8LJE0_9BACT|nr:MULTISPECIES: zinc dependent phospholipase C family protein [Geomonas]QXE91594.1 zinc dependent phospholipase C family protein [Geomonas subterranea]QXM10315.1 zinc dependent phospholipase C family protein [Geomonas subterranea]